MKKELKDYLHLYACAKCLIVKNFGAKVIEETVTINTLYENQFNDGHKSYIKKLILRPLSDMTEEEENEIECEFGSYGLGVNHLCNALKNHDMRYVKRLDDAFNLTRYLLSKHFDIYGLIEAGLAINKSKIKNHE